MPPRYHRSTFIILTLMHIAGVAGLQLPATESLFKLLVPFNLVASVVLLLSFHTDWGRPFVTYAVVAFTGGFLVEVAGVATGAIFGEYRYGPTLGPKLWDVPIVIGFNWLMLNYSANVIVNRLNGSFWLKAAAGAAMMTGLDVILEPIAVRFDFWYWNENVIPFQNYVGWFVTAFCISLCFHLVRFNKQNLLAPLLFILQVLFFMAHRLIEIL